MENCVDIVEMNETTLIVLKQPGSVRHTQGGAIDKILMTVEEARELRNQMTEIFKKLKVE